MQTPSLTRRALTAAGFALLATPAAAASAADARFARLAARYIDTTARLSPIGATTLGDHRFDAEVDDVSAAGRARRRAATQELLKAAEAIPAAELSRDNQVDLALLENQLRYDLWTDEVLGFMDALGIPKAHFAAFPPELIAPCILAGSAPGDLVLDPFLGTGTTAWVARQCGREFIGVELKREYAEMAAARLGWAAGALEEFPVQRRPEAAASRP